MIFRNLDANGDWTFGSGTANYATGDMAIGLNIKTRLLSWVGDCFFALNAGIDWLNRMGKKNQGELLKADIKRVILQSFGVTALTSFSTVIVDRALRANYAVDTIFSRSYKQSVTQGARNA